MSQGFGIEPGSAAKAAEDSAAESSAAPRDQYRGSMGIRMTRAVGQKFELAKPTSGAEAAGITLPRTPEVQPPAARKPSGGPVKSLLALMGGVLRFLGKR